MSTGLENINPGDLRRPIVLQQLTPGQDAAGGYREVWQDWIHTWADIQPKSGRELTEAAQTYPETDVTFRIRWRAGLDPAMRIIDQYGTQYDILGIIDLELRHRIVELAARRRPPERNV